MELCKKKIHMVGIGGIGMSGLAFILKEMGHRVSGSDIEENDIVKKMRKKNIIVDIGHRASQVRNADIVVYSSSIRENNPEIQEAKNRKITVIPRIELLKAIMDGERRTVAVTGSHGKTTITAMASLLLAKSGLDPSVLIGGESPHFQGNAKYGRGNILVAEVDESDGRFVILRPTHLIISNLEQDHAEHYRDEAHLVNVFRKFLKAQSAKSVFFYSLEDANLRKLRKAKRGRRVSFGFSETADVHAANIKVEARKIVFDCFHERKEIGHFTLNIPGVHNVLNALAVISLGIELGIDTRAIKKALSSYKNVKRRFEILGDIKGAKIVQDYAHHPTQIRAAIEAARSINPKRIITVFQPHRYTRTKLFHKEFAASFRGSDEVILTDVYSASEDKIKGADIRSIYDIMARNNSIPVVLLKKKEDIPGYLSQKIKKGDLVLILGAGNIIKTAYQVLAELKR